MFGHVRFQDGNMYTEQSKKLTLNGISNTHTPYKGIWQQSGASFAMKNARCPTRAPFLMPIFIQRAQHQRIHTLGMDSLYVSVHTSFRHGSNRLSCMVLAGLYFE